MTEEQIQFIGGSLMLLHLHTQPTNRPIEQSMRACKMMGIENVPLRTSYAELNKMIIPKIIELFDKTRDVVEG